MLIRIVAWGLYVFLCITLLVLSCCFLIFILVNYASLVEFALSGVNRPDLYDEVTTRLFPPAKYLIVEKASRFVSALAFAFLLFVFKYKREILGVLMNAIHGFGGYCIYFKRTLFQNARFVNIALICVLALLLTRSLFYAHAFDIQHDEAWNYNSFLNKNVLYTFFVYNNYPLHNVVSWLVLQFVPLSTLMLRGPSIVAGLATCMMVFVCIKIIFKSEFIALATTILFSCLPVSVFYMLYARGVMFEMFFCMLICFLIYKYLQGNIGYYKLILIALLNALATYSMLSHAYFILFSSLAILIFFVVRRNFDFRFLIGYAFLSILFSALLLIPMWAGTGLSAGLQAAGSGFNHLSLHLLPYHCYATFMAGAWFVFYLLLALNFFFLFFEKNKEFRILNIVNIVLLTAPVLIKWLTHTYPPERALAFLYVVPVLSIAQYFAFLRMSRIRLIANTLLFSVMLSYASHVNSFLNWSKELDRQVYLLSGVLKENRVSSVHYSSEKFGYFVPGILFYYQVENRSLNVRTSLQGSSRFSNQAVTESDCMVADTLIPRKRRIYTIEGFHVFLNQ